MSGVGGLAPGLVGGKLFLILIILILELLRKLIDLKKNLTTVWAHHLWYASNVQKYYVTSLPDSL